MRIGVLTPWDFGDQNAWSGVLTQMRMALEGRAEIVELSTAGGRTALVDRAAARLTGMLSSKPYLWDHSIATARDRGKRATKLVAEAGPDVVLGIAASTDIAYLDAQEVPVVQVGDATFAAIRDYYPMYSDLLPASAAQANRIEARAAAHTARFVMASQWAIDSFVEDYGVLRSRCSLAQFGPALAPSAPLPSNTQDGALRALLVTSDWNRKGGDRAVSAVGQLREQGSDIELTVVGRTPPTLPSWVRNLGRLPREQLEAEYRAADVLLELAVANCGGVTMTDAASFGLPAIATDTGGVSSIVVDGESGFLVSAAAEDTVRQASEALRNVSAPDTLGRLRDGALRRHETVLNWDSWADSVMAACRSAAAR